jgi:hypothetical protein
VSGLRFVADENLDERLVVAVLRRVDGCDVVRVRDVGRVGRSDADLLKWAARHGRIVITHDVRTMPNAAYARVASRTRMPGVLIVPSGVSSSGVVDDLVLIAEAGVPEDFRDRVVFLPLT